jgi:CheY-like chemotaxis protein
MKLRVLVFEDDDPIRRMLQMALERIGCEVHAYANPDLCPLVHEQPCPCRESQVCADAVISDVNMPVMSGLELVGSLQDHGCNVRRYLLASGNWSEWQANRARQMGCEVIGKPFDLRFILKWVTQCLETIEPERVLLDWTWDEGSDRRPAD